MSLLSDVVIHVLSTCLLLCDVRIQVNDQIIEVDGKSLVGVTQAYAASVLRNTSGKVKYVVVNALALSDFVQATHWCHISSKHAPLHDPSPSHLGLPPFLCVPKASSFVGYVDFSFVHVSTWLTAFVLVLSPVLGFAHMSYVRCGFVLLSCSMSYNHSMPSVNGW